MTTIADIIEQAMRKIGVVGHGQTANGEQSRAALQTFNLMLHGWRLDGIDAWRMDAALGPPTSGLDPQDYEATADFPMPAAFREGAVYCLAARLAPEYMVPAAFSEEAFLSKMRAHLMVIDDAEIDPALSYVNMWGGRTWRL